MSSPPVVTWRDVPAPLRVLARWVTIAQAAGYGVSLVMVPRLPRTADTLAAAHAHLLGMTALFAITGLCFALCERPGGRWKTALLATPFIAILVAFTAVWLAKELDHRLTLLLPVTGVVMSLAALSVVQIAAAGWSIARYESTLSSGTPHKIHVAPVDPACSRRRV